MTWEEEAYFEEKLQEIPRNVLEHAIETMKKEMNTKALLSIRFWYALRGVDWMVPFHLSTGMYLRNCLRQAGLKDDMLPDGNWDDYYTQVIEVALNLRRSPLGGYA